MGTYVNNNKVNLGTQYNLSEATKEIAALVGVTARADGKIHLADVCLAENINKWSKRKPIEHPSTGPLTDEQRKGSDTDQANGIFYGVEVVGGQNISLFNNLVGVHGVSFVYHRPTGWKRIRDFNGYAHNAQPKPYGELPSEGYYNDSAINNKGINNIVCSYASGDDTGIDFTDRFVGADAMNVLRYAFPAIVITQGSKTYFTALNYEDGTFRPLYNGSNYATGTWYCQLSKKVMYGPDELNTPFSSGANVTASVVLIRSASNSLPLLNVAGQNFGTHWIDATYSQSSNAYLVIVAGQLGKTVTIKEYFNGIIFNPTAVTASKTVGKSPSFSVNVEELTGKTSSNTITVTASITLSSGKSASYTTTMNGYTGLIKPLLSVTFSDLLHTSGATYSGTCTVTTKDGNATNSRTLTFSNI